MKKLYRKGTVHPSPSTSPPTSPPTISDHLSFLPTAILTLTLSLSPEDREVLAYLISCSSNSFSGNPRRNPKVVIDGDHPAVFNCSCFRCYMRYWVRWNSSPNHQLIHEIIDAFEDSLTTTTTTTKLSRKDKRNKRASKTKPPELTRSEFPSSSPPKPMPESSSSTGGAAEVDVAEAGDEEEKGSVRKFVSFIGERIWGAWAQ